MPCYHPITAWRTREGKDPVTGKWPITFNVKEADILKTELSLPCGKCIGCRLERSRQWAIRCIQEASLYDQNCFLTLTYNDEALKERCGIYDEEINGVKQYSLNKRDFVLFMKKLRKEVMQKYGKRVRFFHAGEYGELCRECRKPQKSKYPSNRCSCPKFIPDLGRPHHHVCIFNYEFRDKELWDTKNGVVLYRSDTLEQLWGHGYCVIGDVTFESAAYVARYCLKKISGHKADNHYDGREPEYVTMSRRPGIGAGWFQKYRQDVTSYDHVVIRNNLIIRPPKYYDKLYDLTNHKEMEVTKRNRLKHHNAADSTPERLTVRERLARLKLENHKRNQEKI